MSYSFLLKGGQVNTVPIPVGSGNNGQTAVLNRKSSTLNSTSVIANGKATFTITADRVQEFAGSYTVTVGGSVVQNGDIDVVAAPVTGGGGDVDLSNYYNKSQTNSTIASAVANKADLNYVNTQLSGKASTTDLATKANSADLKPVATSGNFADLSGVPDLSGFETVSANTTKLAAKADASTVYNKTQVDSQLANYTNTTALNTALSAKANSSDVYSKSQVDTSIAAKANAADVYTKTQTDSSLAAKANVSDVYTKTQSDTNNALKANVSDVYTKTQSDSALSAKANTSDFTTATDVVTTSGLTTSLAPYAKTADVSGVYLRITDYQDLVNRVSTLETNAGITPGSRPTRPSTSAQPSFWLRGDKITQSSGTISAWADEVNSRAFTVPTGRVAPTYLATGVNNKPAALFSKSAISGLFYAKALKAENQTIFVVFSVPALAVGAGLVQAVASADNSQTNLNVNTYVHSSNGVVAGVNGNTGNNGFSGTQISTANAGQIGRMTYGTGAGVGTNSAKALLASVNGGANGSAAATQGFTAVASDGFSLGGSGTATTANAIDMRIAEVIIFDTELSSADKVTWTQYLGTTYSITVGNN